jgi:hypothetical protein
MRTPTNRFTVARIVRTRPVTYLMSGRRCLPAFENDRNSRKGWNSGPMGAVLC